VDSMLTLVADSPLLNTLQHTTPPPVHKVHTASSMQSLDIMQLTHAPGPPIFNTTTTHTVPAPTYHRPLLCCHVIKSSILQQ